MVNLILRQPFNAAETPIGLPIGVKFFDTVKALISPLKLYSQLLYQLIFNENVPENSIFK